MVRVSSITRLATVAIAGMLASACIPIPLTSGYPEGSRQNVPAQVPDFIVKGQTTRADVVLALGAPDRIADDGSWLLYASAYSEGGLAMILVAPAPATGAAAIGEQTMRYRLLVVRFDDSGLVSSADLTEKSCPEWAVAAGSSGSEPIPCLDVSGATMAAVDRATAAAPGEDLIATYRPVLWWHGREHPPDLGMWSKPRDPGTWADLAVTNAGIVLTPALDPLPGDGCTYRTVPLRTAIRLPFAKIAAVSAETRNLVPYVELQFDDGSYDSIQVMTRTGTATYFWDSKQTRDAGLLMQERLQALPGKAPDAATPP